MTGRCVLDASFVTVRDDSVFVMVVVSSSCPSSVTSTSDFRDTDARVARLVVPGSVEAIGFWGGLSAPVRVKPRNRD